jgi:hypothetical protein
MKMKPRAVMTPRVIAGKDLPRSGERHKVYAAWLKE